MDDSEILIIPDMPFPAMVLTKDDVEIEMQYSPLSILFPEIVLSEDDASHMQPMEHGSVMLFLKTMLDEDELISSASFTAFPHM